MAGRFLAMDFFRFPRENDAMPLPNSDDPKLKAREQRFIAVRQAEVDYKNALSLAETIRRESIQSTIATEKDTIRKARELIEQSRKYAATARDRIEAKMRKQDLIEVQRAQEAVVFKAGKDRIQAIKLAFETAKGAVLKAGEARLKAIRQAEEDEKQSVVQARQKTRSKRESERIQQEQKRRDSLALKQTEKVKRADAAKKAIHEAEEARRKTAQQAEAQKKAVIQAREDAKSARENERILAEQKRKDSRALMKQEQKTKQIEAAGTKTKAKAETLMIKTGSQPEPAAPKSENRQQPAADGIPSPETKIVTSPDANPAKKKNVSLSDSAKVPAKRSGIIKLIISSENSDSENISDLEASLSNVPGVHLLMVGGAANDGVQIALKAEDELPLTGILRLLPNVEEVIDRQSDILIKLKQSVNK
jgi:hypothetical protein